MVLPSGSCASTTAALDVGFIFSSQISGSLSGSLVSSLSKANRRHGILRKLKHIKISKNHTSISNKPLFTRMTLDYPVLGDNLPNWLHLVVLWCVHECTSKIIYPIINWNYAEWLKKWLTLNAYMNAPNRACTLRPFLVPSFVYLLVRDSGCH